MKHKGESFVLGGMRGGFSLKNLNNSMLACPRLYWVMFNISAELATRRWEPSFPQLSTSAFDAEIPDPASTDTGWNPEVFPPFFYHTAITAATNIKQTSVSQERGATKLLKTVVRALYCALSLYCHLLQGKAENKSIWKPRAAITAFWFLVLATDLGTTTF